MKKITSLIMIIVFSIAIVLTGCSAKNTANTAADNTKKEVSNTKYPLKVTDAFKREIVLDKEPERIVSVSPSITEIIYSLGKGSNLVGRTDYDDYPAEVTKVNSIGNLTNPSEEKIIDLKPDVVFVSDITSKDTVKKLEDLKIKVIVYSGEQSFDGTYKNIDSIAEVLNAKDKANTIIDGMKAKVKEVEDKVKDAKKPSVYYVVGYGQSGDFTSGKGTFIGQMIELAGGTNAANDVEGWNYSVEKLVSKNPDLMICSKFFDTKKGIEATAGYKDLKAVKENKLLEIDDNLINRQGPRLADGLEAMAKLIHPELFK
ncbi:ABC transporter substrate-binding protein [Candidatus Clostridium radicumherbarum]|uniref:ABC transporter substrate-binding protein n=1 Tax=Candidatus Clostridium radicumherbarum TaxID=3381662 RepID=A0ABW8TRC5_9CLOT